MRIPNPNDYISLTTKRYIEEGCKLNILLPSEVCIKEKNNEYIVISSSLGIAEIKNGFINLSNAPKEITIKKGETKKLTLPVTDYFDAVTISY